MWPSFWSCRTEWEETQAQGLATKGFSFHFSKRPAPWEQPWCSHLTQHQALCLLSTPGEPLLRPYTLSHARGLQGWSAAPCGGTLGTLASLWRQINEDWAHISGHTAQADSFLWSQPPLLWAEVDSQQAGMMLKPCGGTVRHREASSLLLPSEAHKPWKRKHFLLWDCIMAECKRGAVGSSLQQTNTAPET